MQKQNQKKCRQNEIVRNYKCEKCYPWLADKKNNRCVPPTKKSGSSDWINSSDNTLKFRSTHYGCDDSDQIDRDGICYQCQEDFKWNSSKTECVPIKTKKHLYSSYNEHDFIRNSMNKRRFALNEHEDIYDSDE